MVSIEAGEGVPSLGQGSGDCSPKQEDGAPINDFVGLRHVVGSERKAKSWQPTAIPKQSSVTDIEKELIKHSGQHLETHAAVQEDNLFFFENLLERKPELAPLIANAKDEHDRPVIQVAPARVRELLNSYLSSIPFLRSLPSTVSRDVYEASVSLALRYANAGVEGEIHGHILVLGDPTALLALGSRNKFDPFWQGNGDIRDPADCEEIRRCMNADGMTVIDGRTGAPVANKFFSSGTSENACGGARSKAALWIAEMATAIVIKVGEDTKGEITVHCRHGPDGQPLTAQHSSSAAIASEFSSPTSCT
jgi:hypothetical protein